MCLFVFASPDPRPIFPQSSVIVFMCLFVFYVASFISLDRTCCF
jgi:hypothetical protein